MTHEPDLQSSQTTGRLRALNRLSVGLQMAGDDASIIRELHAGVQRLGLAAFIGRYEAATQVVRLFSVGEQAVPRWPSDGEPAPASVAVDASPLLGKALWEHETAFCADPAVELFRVLPIGAASARERRSILRGFGRAILAPMVVHGRASGVLVVLGHGLAESDGESIRDLASHLAVAFDNAAVLRELKQALLREHAAARELRRLESLVADLAAETEQDTVLRRVARAAADALAIEQVAVYLRAQKSGQLALAVSRGLEAALAGRLTALLSDRDRNPLAQALEAGTAAVVPDTRADARWSLVQSTLEAVGIRSAWFVPMVSRQGERLGALGFFSASVGAPSPEQLDLAQRYAHHAALALAGSRQRQRETNAARTEALVELARSIPHELGQPLAIIAGYAELIAEGLLGDDRLREACGEIVAAANNLSELVQRLERITSYATKEYGPGRTVIDFERAAQPEQRES